MKKEKTTIRFNIITVMILLAAMSRLIPRPANFAPIGGMALFGAAYFSKKYYCCPIQIINTDINN